MLERRRNLPQVGPDLAFINVLLSRPVLPDQLLEISLFSPFDHNEHFVELDKTLDISNNEVVLQLFKELNLFDALVSLLLVIHIEDLALRKSITFKSLSATL